MTELPKITDSVGKTAELALQAIRKQQKDRARLLADLLRAAGFSDAAHRIRTLTETLPDKRRDVEATAAASVSVDQERVK